MDGWTREESQREKEAERGAKEKDIDLHRTRD